MQDMLTLNEELKTISGRKRRFLLLRIIDVGVEEAKKLCGIKQGTYNTWLHNSEFAQLYRRRAELSAEFRIEALRLMRRDNQLQAVLLEEKILEKMKDEIATGKYELIKTRLAGDVYSKLINDLDYQPSNLSLTWEQRIQQLDQGQGVPQITEGEVIDGEIISETISGEENQHTESQPLLESEQAPDEVKEETQES